METSELQRIWKNVDAKINRKSDDELTLLLASVSRHTINKFMFIISMGILSGLGLLVFLTITSLNRKEDVYYLINNITLGIIAVISLYSGLISWYKLHSNKNYNQSLKGWLEYRINLLSGLLTGKLNKLYVLLIPVIYVLTILSIHVYFKNKPMIEVLHTEESISGLVAGTLTGLLVSFIAVINIRRYELKNLEFLKDLYNRL